jgi:D-alanyl-lipoteichoic acid acyltransferase DltB (MBOAT superfamily)
VCLADLVFAPVVDQVFAVGAAPSAAEIWLGASSFSLQAYCDFGGYSLCAIGIAMMFGFRFPLNFDSPFGAVGMADLWTRWHMSLSTWLRDYIFKPMGGYRHGRLRGHLNLIVTFLLCGLWHGAAWTYVIWGGLNGLFQVLERVFRDHVFDFVDVELGVHGQFHALPQVVQRYAGHTAHVAPIRQRAVHIGHQLRLA